MDQFLNPTSNSATPISLSDYLQGLDQETVARMSRPSSPEVMALMDQHIMSLLGHLPPQEFDVTITTNRENLGRLLATALMSGYFLRGAEQRLKMEQSLANSHEL